MALDDRVKELDVEIDELNTWVGMAKCVVGKMPTLQEAIIERARCLTQLVENLAERPRKKSG